MKQLDNYIKILFRKNKKAFTFVEVLVAVLIIALISTLVMISLSNSRSKGRDLKRINDINQIQVALENYKNVEGRYPEELNFGGSLIGSSSDLIFLDQVPEVFDYYYNSSSLSYDINFEIENNVMDMSPGVKCANSSGILDSACCRDYCLSYLDFVSSSDGIILNKAKTYNLFYYLQKNNIYENLILFLSSDGGLKIESSGVDGVGEIFDLSLNKKNAIQANTDLQPKLINGFVYFDGVDDYLMTSAVSKLNVYSISVWINGTRARSSGGIFFGNGISLGRWGISLQGGKINSVNTYDDQASHWWSIEYYNEDNYPNEWDLITITDDGSVRKFYRNGQFISQVSNNTQNIGSDRGMNLGRGGSTFASYFQGYINDAMYFNKALSAEEILSLYNNTKKYYNR